MKYRKKKSAPTGPRLMLKSKDSALREWITAHTSGWKQGQLDAVSDWADDAWTAYRTIIEEFGELWPRINGVSAQVIVGTKIKNMPPATRTTLGTDCSGWGIEYSHPYSLGLHLNALREARGGAPRGQDTSGNYPALRTGNRLRGSGVVKIHEILP